MHQLILLIPTSVDLNKFDESWPSFLEAAEQMPGLIRESVSRVDQIIFGQEYFQRIYTFSFQDKISLEKALFSDSGEKAGSILHGLTGGKLTLLTADYQEDSLKNIQSFSSLDSDG
ncbi:MAG: hypothetical protein MUO54_04465 [Anaerolineales bacterium]|nr:hypothetical protein [Anaerolineales bacterium]